MAEMYQRLQDIIPRLPEVLFVLLIALFGIPFVIVVTSKTLKRLGMGAAVVSFISYLIRYLLWLLVLLSVLYSLGFTGIAATLSGSVVLVGLVLSQSLKELLTDIIAGFSLARDHDFEVGYTVEASSNKIKGVVKSVGLRKVRLINEVGYTVVVPNSKVESNEWVVLDRETKLKTTKKKT